MNRTRHRTGPGVSDALPHLCHIVHHDGPGGGPEAVVVHLGFLKSFFKQSVLHGGAGRIAAACDELGVSHKRLPIERHITVAWGTMRLWEELRRSRPDVVVLHGQWAGPIGALAAKLAGVRRIVYLAQWPSFYTDWDLFRVVRNYWCERIPCRMSDMVITLSESNRYQYILRKHVTVERTVLIPNPVDLSKVPLPESARELRSRLGWEDALCHVVSVGRLSDQKRVDWLLRAWAIIHRNGLRAKLWIVGDGPDQEKLHKLAEELALSESCVFLGARKDGMQYLAAADIAAITSCYEASPYVPVEAMACGVPLVGNNVDGMKDRVTDGEEGFLVEVGDVEGFAARLAELIANRDLRSRLGANGRKRAQRYAIEVVMPRYLDLYQRLTQAPGLMHGAT